jgi:hypothetical protein
MKLSSASGRTDQPTQTMPRPRPRGKSKKKVKYGKAPQAPKRFKSAYMFFSTTMHPEIRLRLGQKGTKEKVHQFLVVVVVLVYNIDNDLAPPYMSVEVEGIALIAVILVPYNYVYTYMI